MMPSADWDVKLGSFVCEGCGCEERNDVVRDASVPNKAEDLRSIVMSFGESSRSTSLGQCYVPDCRVSGCFKFRSPRRAVFTIQD
jgi:hypothetical protein